MFMMVHEKSRLAYFLEGMLYQKTVKLIFYSFNHYIHETI